MPNVNYKQLYAIKKNNEKRILSICPGMKNQSGIYFYTRTDENGISYFYIGQSVDCLERNISHLSGFQHIDLSIKKRGFYSEENPYGWKLDFIHYPREKLDEMEQYWILEYTKKGYQCRRYFPEWEKGQDRRNQNPAFCYKNTDRQRHHLYGVWSG